MSFIITKKDIIIANTEHPKVAAWYNNYLLSKSWAKKKAAIHKRDHNKCRCCTITENLVVHHLTYENVMHERLEDLILVCKECHILYYHTHRIIPYSDKIYDENYGKSTSN